MKCVRIQRTGPPAECAEVTEIPCPEPGPGEVLVRMAFSPVNPADLNFIEGTYGTKPELPSTPGMEGAGIVESSGPGAEHILSGTPVVPLRAGRCWAEYTVCRADQLFLLPPGCDLRQAAMLRVNPATTWGLLHTAGPLPPGSWVVQNAASSACGHCVIQLAKHLGLRIACLVRRPESIADCLALGADAALTDDTDAPPALKSLFGNEPPALALNAVGGESALRLMDLLAPGGLHVTYGAMARQPLKVPNGLLIFKGIRLQGYWMTRWLDTAPAVEIQSVYRTLASLVSQGTLRQQIAAEYPLEEIAPALTHAARSARGGKVMLRVGGSS